MDVGCVGQGCDKQKSIAQNAALTVFCPLGSRVESHEKVNDVKSDGDKLFSYNFIIQLVSSWILTSPQSQRDLPHVQNYFTPVRNVSQIWITFLHTTQSTTKLKIFGIVHDFLRQTEHL